MMDGEQIDNDSIRHQLHNLQQRFDKISKENRNLIKFNDDLRAQIKLLTGKLQLHQKLDQATTSSKDSNTFDCLHCGHRSLSITKGWQDEATAKQMPIKDLVASAAQEVITSQDYVYDEKSRTYYIKSSGWLV